MFLGGGGWSRFSAVFTASENTKLQKIDTTQIVVTCDSGNLPIGKVQCGGTPDNHLFNAEGTTEAGRRKEMVRSGQQHGTT